MQLTMYIGNDLIEAVPINVSELSKPGYLGRFKRQLKQRYICEIQEANVQPEFFIVDLAPATEARQGSYSYGSK